MRAMRALHPFSSLSVFLDAETGKNYPQASLYGHSEIQKRGVQVAFIRVQRLHVESILGTLALS
jgi:hypothetical protein